MLKRFPRFLATAAVLAAITCVTGCNSSSGTIVLEEEVPRDPSLNDSFYGDAVYSDDLNDQ